MLTLVILVVAAVFALIAAWPRVPQFTCLAIAVFLFLLTLIIDHAK